MKSSVTSSSRSLLALLAGVVLLVVVLTRLGGWALPVVVAAIVVMVMGHEFGHFITAKRSGMLVTDFFVGFGPVVWSTTIGETRYGVRAFLLGGYVKVPGMAWGDELDADAEKRTYRSASYPRKVLFASAGSLMHMVMALLLAWASLTLVGLPSSNAVGISSFSHWDGYSSNAAQRAGLKVGDRILSVNGQAVTSFNALVADVRRSSGKTLTIQVLRAGHDVTLKATPVNAQNLTSNGKRLYTGAAPEGLLGIQLSELTVRSSWYGAIPSSFTKLGSLIGSDVRALIHVFSPGQFSSLLHQVASPAAANNRTTQLTRPESIVGVVRIAVQSAQSGPAVLLQILMMVNIFVGLFNMLPMLPLDGGYVAIATYERIRSRRGVHYHANINLLAPLVYAFMSVLLVLFASTLYLDIVHPIANPFQ